MSDTPAPDQPVSFQVTFWRYGTTGRHDYQLESLPGPWLARLAAAVSLELQARAKIQATNPDPARLREQITDNARHAKVYMTEMRRLQRVHMIVTGRWPPDADAGE